MAKISKNNGVIQLQDAWNAMEEFGENMKKRYDCDVSEGYWIYKEHCGYFLCVIS